MSDTDPPSGKLDIPVLSKDTVYTTSPFNSNRFINTSFNVETTYVSKELVVNTGKLARVSIDVLVKEPGPLKLSHVLLESLINIPNDPVTLHSRNSFLKQQTTLASILNIPSDVWSKNDTFAIKEIVIQQRLEDQPEYIFSTSSVKQNKQQAVLSNTTEDPVDTWSKTRVGVFTEQVVLSTNNPYIPLSASVIKLVTQQSLVSRTSVDFETIWSSVRVGSYAEQILQSTEIPFWKTPPLVHQYKEQVLQSRETEWPLSGSWNYFIKELVVRQRTELTWKSSADNRLLKEMVITKAEFSPVGGGQTFSVRQQIVVPPITTLYPPAYALGNRVNGFSSLTTLFRTTVDPGLDIIRSTSRYNSIDVQYVIGGINPLLISPENIFDDSNAVSSYSVKGQAVYKAVASLFQNPANINGVSVRSILERPIVSQYYLPPHLVPETTDVFVESLQENVIVIEKDNGFVKSPIETLEVHEYLVMVDSYPGVQPLPVFQTFESIVISVEDYIDPSTPFSEIDTSLVLSEAIVEDDGYSSLVENSDLMSTNVIEQIVSPSWYPESTLPLSDVDTLHLYEAISTDKADSFENPNIPKSDLLVHQVSSSVSLYDESQTWDAISPKSSLDITHLHTCVISEDHSLYEIPNFKKHFTTVVTTISNFSTGGGVVH